jgi:AraC-like DNA-binding protein
MYSALQFLISRLDHAGIPRREILRGTGIRQNDLDDPWPYLDYQQYQRFVANIYRLTGNPAAGLNLNRGFRISHMGLPGFATLTSPDFRTAREMIMNYRVLKDTALFPVHKIDRKNWIMAFRETYPLGDDARRFSSEGQLARTAQFCRELSGWDDPIVSIHLSYPAPEYADLYEDIFRCPVYFGDTQTRVVFNKALLYVPLPNASEEVNDLCRHECQLRLSQMEARESVKNKVYQELSRHYSLDGDALLSLCDVAGRMYLSPRTLRRKLLAEGTSFQKIANAVRRDLAVYYLQETGLSTKEIAHSLGYRSVNNFHRAFKEWTGDRISSYRPAS